MREMLVEWLEDVRDRMTDETSSGSELYDRAPHPQNCQMCFLDCLVDLLEGEELDEDMADALAQWKREGRL